MLSQTDSVMVPTWVLRVWYNLVKTVNWARLYHRWISATASTRKFERENVECS